MSDFSEIRLSGITKAFPGVVANDSIDLTIKPGEVLCLLGENGAGKSTLISILAGMQQPDEGEIFIDDSPVKLTSPKISQSAGIGVVHQHSTLVPSFTILENLLLGQRTFFQDKQAATKRFTELSQIIGIDLNPHALVNDLGLGQQQQVEIIKAMWKGSKLLILDEPTSMLTPQAIAKLQESIENLKREGLAVVLITHKLWEAYEMGDAITVLRQGRNAGFIGKEELKSLDSKAAQERILSLMFGEEVSLDGKDAEAAGVTTSHVDDTDKIESAAGVVDDSEVLLELSNVYTAPEGEEQNVKDLSLKLRRGEILGVAGIDGHGQKHLAEVCAGQRKPLRGTVLFDQEDISNLGVMARQKIGIRYVTDDRLYEGTIGDMPVSINLVLKNIGMSPFWSKGMIKRSLINKHAEELVEEFDIRTPSVATRVATLSGGNIQKVLMSRELSGGAKVLIINKPTYGLDLKTVTRIHDLIKEFAEKGGSVIVMSTDLDELTVLADRIIVLSDGKIAGSTQNVGNVAERVGAMMTGVMEVVGV